MLHTLEWMSNEKSLSFILIRTLRLQDRQAVTPRFHYLRLLFSALSRLATKKDTAFRGKKPCHENITNNKTITC